MSNFLKFSSPNRKIAFPSFSIPSGYTCPGASNCLTFVDRITNKIIDKQKPDENGETFRCYAASLEVAYSSLRENLRHNESLLKEAKTEKAMTALIIKSLKESKWTKALVMGGGALRNHIHGDFFNLNYLSAWMNVAKFFPNIRIYSYTKSLHLLKKYKDKHGSFPSNYYWTWSKGSKFDKLGPVLGLKSATIVDDKEQAKALGLEVDHDDTHALNGTKDFALEPHGQQPKGSRLAKLLIEKRKAGKFAGYGKTPIK
tara:strand:+ start:175 stop:945 length:771 start_codon:yes stop_codon:yes gene_type:complete